LRRGIGIAFDGDDDDADDADEAAADEADAIANFGIVCR